MAGSTKREIHQKEKQKKLKDCPPFNGKPYNVSSHERIDYKGMALSDLWLFKVKGVYCETIERLLFGYPYDKVLRRKDGRGRTQLSLCLDEEADAIVDAKDGKHCEFLTPFLEAEDPKPRAKIQLVTLDNIKRLNNLFEQAVQAGFLKEDGNRPVVFLKWLRSKEFVVPDGLIPAIEKGNIKKAIRLPRKLRELFLAGIENKAKNKPPTVPEKKKKLRPKYIQEAASIFKKNPLLTGSEMVGKDALRNMVREAGLSGELSDNTIIKHWLPEARKLAGIESRFGPKI